MSNASYQEVIKTGAKVLAGHREMYLESGGTRGHIMDFRGLGGRYFTTTLLLKVTGRKSGTDRIVALLYGDLDGEVIVVASKGGADDHPAWYLNIRDNKEIAFQIGTQAFRGSWRELHGVEYAKVWDFMVGVYPPYVQYQASTKRKIPLIALTAHEPIDVFQ